MNQVLDRLSRLVTARPYVTLAVLLVVTVVLAAGASLRGELSETEGFLPPDSAIAQAMDDIEERFGESGEVSIVSLVFRGEALTPTGLAQIDALTDRIVSEPGRARVARPRRCRRVACVADPGCAPDNAPDGPTRVALAGGN